MNRVLKTWPEKTQQAIAEQVGCGQATVHRVKDELIQVNKMDIPPTRTGKDGKQYPAAKDREEKTVVVPEEQALNEADRAPPPWRHDRHRRRYNTRPETIAACRAFSEVVYKVEYKFRLNVHIYTGNIKNVVDTVSNGLWLTLHNVSCTMCASAGH